MDTRKSATSDGGIERENNSGERERPTDASAASGGGVDSEGHNGRSERESGSVSGRVRGALGRRTWLKAIGAYAGGRGLLGLSGRAAAAPYMTYELDAGEIFDRQVESGETFENALIDVSAEGAGFDIDASGTDWTIRNVGIAGEKSAEGAGSAFGLEVAAGGTGVFENVYVGDGAANGGGAGIFVPTSHAGTLRIRRCHVANWPDNGIYASAPGRDARNGQGGVVRIAESYAHDNNIAGFRLGTDGSSIVRSVAHVEGDVMENAAGKENGRGIWVKEGGSVRIEDCDVLVEDPDGTAGVIESENGATGRARVVDSSVAARGSAERFEGNVSRRNVDSDPDVSLPASVPASASAAARGESGDGGTGEENRATGRKTIEVVGGNSDDDEYIDYTVTTDGDLTGKDSIESGESPADGRVEGTTGGSGDAFVTTGAVESIDATLTGSEGQRRASVTISEDGGTSRIRLAGGNDEGPLRYKLDVTGSVSATESIEERRTVGASSARGATTGSADELVFTGEIRLFRAALPPDGGRFLVKVKPGR